MWEAPRSPIIFGCIGITVFFSMKDWDLSHLKPYLGTGFSSYEAVSMIALGEFFTRIEVLIGIVLLLTATMFWVADSQELRKIVPLVPVYSLPIQVLAPLAALIAGKLRNRRSPKKQTRKQPRTAQETPSL